MAARRGGCKTCTGIASFGSEGTQNNETRVSVEVVSFRMHFLMFQGFVRTALRRERDFWQDSPPAPGMLRR